MTITAPLTPGTLAGSGGNTTTSAVPYPTGGSILADDLLILAIGIEGGSSTNGIATPSGWTLIGTVTSGSTLRTSVFYKLAAGGETGTVTVTHDASIGTQRAAGMYALRGVDTADPLDVDGTTGSSATLPSITTLTNSAWRVDVVGRSGNDGGTAVTPHANQTERWDVWGGSFFNRETANWCADEPITTAGSTGTRAITAPNLYGTVTFAVKPAGSPGAVLEASSAGTSTAAASNLKLDHALAALSAGTSTAAAERLVLNHTLAGVSAGLATVTGDLTKPGAPLVGLSAGLSTATASNLSLPRALAGLTAGTSTTAAALILASHALSGLSQGTSTAAAHLSGPSDLTGSSAGTSTASASNLLLQHTLAAISAGTSTAGASTVMLSWALTGSSAGTSTAAASNLKLEHALSSLAAGSSTAAASLRLTAALAGQASGLASTAGDLNVRSALAGSSAGLATVQASLTALTHFEQLYATRITTTAYQRGTSTSDNASRPVTDRTTQAFRPLAEE